MTDHPLAADAVLAAELVRAAGLLAASMLADGLRTEHKTSVSDVVSAADRAAEKLIADRLSADRPAEGVTGEEGAAQPSGTGRTWFVDPVDGTYNFLSGLPFWCSAVALVDESGPLVGAVYAPVFDELWIGGPDWPTTCNGKLIETLADCPLAEQSVASYLHPATLPDDDTREPLLAAIRGAATVRMLGSGSVELASVAGGRLGAWVQHDSLDWDWYPGAALVLGAGGVAETLHHRGRRWHLAGNRVAVAELAALLTAG